MRSRRAVRRAFALGLFVPAIAAAAPLRLSIRVHDGIVPDLAFAGRYLALAAQNEGIRLFDATTGDLVRTVAVTEPIRATAIDADDIFVAAYAVSGVNRYATATGALVSTIPLGFEPSTLVRDGERLLVTGEVPVPAAYLVDVPTGATRAVWPVPTPPRFAFFGAAAFSRGVPVVGLVGPTDSVLVSDPSTGTWPRRIDMPLVDVRVGVVPVGGDLVTGAETVPPPDVDPDEAPKPPGRVHQFDAATGTLRRTLERHNPSFGGLFGGIAAAGSTGFLVAEPTDDGGSGGSVYYFDAATGDVLDRLEWKPGPDAEFALRIAARDAEALVLGADGAGHFVVNLYDLGEAALHAAPPPPESEPIARAGAAGRIRVGCPAGRGTCRAVGRVAGEAVTRRGRSRRRRRRAHELVLRLDGRGRALLASSPDGLAVDVALRVTDRAHVARTATATVVVR